MTSSPKLSEKPPRWPWSWGCLLLALAWVGVVRVPLVLNARVHLDSDLAVDGLTLIDALNGHWRWHYPATPFIGTPPVLLSWPQARIWGATPITLVSGSVVAYGLIVVATFVLNRRAFGSSVAAWGLVPLIFASTGTIWLSGRVTGGHLLTVAWHAWAFVLFWDLLVKGGWLRSALLGLWCGLGLYVDSMFAVTWAGLGLGWLIWMVLGRPRSLTEAGDKRFARAMAGLLLFAMGAGLGVVPRIIGKRVDPHDAYVGQFDPVTRFERVAKNAGFLVQDCWPRLVSGHRLPGLQTEPDPSSLPGGSPATALKGIPWPGIAVTVMSLSLFVAAFWKLTSGAPSAGLAQSTDQETGARRAICWGLLTSSAAVLAGFLIHPRIENSDNYRYLVIWLVPWSSGFGLLMAGISAKRPGGKWLAGALALGFAALMTVDTARWYDRFGWVDSRFVPVRKAVDDQVLDWLDDHLRFTVIYGNYWDVYRLSFLTGGRLRGIPFGEYPQRFPEHKTNLPSRRNRVIIIRPDTVGPRYRAQAMALGAREVGKGEGFSIIQWPDGMTP